MALRKPGVVLRRIVHKHFDRRARGTFCMTRAEFERQWSYVEAEAGYEGFPQELLKPYKDNLERRWIPLPDSFNKKRFSPPSLGGISPLSVYDQEMIE